jgi:Fic family protein
MSAIYNSAGIAVYLTPPPEEIIPTLTQMIKTYDSSQNPLLSAMIFHYQFEKLHPFVDGNGRVGRLLLSQALFTHSYSLNGTITLDQQIEARRSGYYDTLARENKDLTPFLEYMLECLLTSQNLALKSLVSSTPNSTHLLAPRRAELLETIRDHAPCSFDFLHRRFYAVKPSTLHYELQQLEKKGLIHKLGTTRGALYSDLAPE